MGIAVGISLIAALEPEISWEVILSPWLPKTVVKIVIIRGLKCLLSTMFSVLCISTNTEVLRIFHSEVMEYIFWHYYVM